MLEATTIALPLRTDADGAIRIGNTRVLLEIVVHAFWRGETPENIVESFPTLTLADVYAVIAYYLQNRAAVDGYMQAADADAQQMMQTIRTKTTDLGDLRTRLLSQSVGN